MCTMCTTKLSRRKQTVFPLQTIMYENGPFYLSLRFTQKAIFARSINFVNNILKNPVGLSYRNEQILEGKYLS